MISPETCDDGLQDGVGCTSACDGQMTGYTCSGGDISTPTNCADVCGDGIVTPSQTCDDSNSVPTDGCDSNC